MIIFNTDLDNTMIFSYKHDIGEDKKCVEIYEGREVSFMTKQTGELLDKVGKEVLVVPTTTRTVEQYNRICLGIGTIPYALVCNGGVLLIDGQEDEEWYEESLRMVEDCQEQLKRAETLLSEDENTTFEVRNIKNLFVFTKNSEPVKMVEKLRRYMDLSLVDVFSNGVKVYVVPVRLSKGMAVKRLKNKLRADAVIVAGDSEFDISMIEVGDFAVAPKGLAETVQLPEHTFIMREERVFSEFVLEKVQEVIRRRD